MTKFNAVDWMYRNGHPSYANQINDLEMTIDEFKSEAGANWQFCEYTLDTIAKIRKEIEEIRGAAEDRYQDWATD